jgi:predicted metal-dependent peptidase
MIDISGSMNTGLIDRILNTISKKMKKINNALTYDIITWNTNLGEHLRDIKASDVVPKVRYGGGTILATGIKYFKENYGKEAIFIIISDFEDCLEDWHREEMGMTGYTMYGFNYGREKYKQEFTNLKVLHFTDGY